MNKLLAAFITVALITSLAMALAYPNRVASDMSEAAVEQNADVCVASELVPENGTPVDGPEEEAARTSAYGLPQAFPIYYKPVTIESPFIAAPDIFSDISAPEKPLGSVAGIPEAAEIMTIGSNPEPVEKPEPGVDVSPEINYTYTPPVQNELPDPEVLENAEYLGEYWVTGYAIWCPDCQGQWVGMSASGMELIPGYSVAMCSDFPFGSKIYIEGYGIFEVADRGGAIGPGRIDVACNTHEECANYTGNYRVWLLPDE